METEQENIWHPFEFFVGSWKGIGGGEPGVGEYTRTYKFIFNQRFLEIRNTTTYPPTEKDRKGEIHEDVGYISFDKIRHTFVLRQFHVEGFVNQYILNTLSPDGRKIIFVTESIENISVGWRARETYQLSSENEFTETFELAPPDGEFEVYTTVTFRK